MVAKWDERYEETSSIEAIREYRQRTRVGRSRQRQAALDRCYTIRFHIHTRTHM